MSFSVREYFFQKILDLVSLSSVLSLLDSQHGIRAGLILSMATVPPSPSCIISPAPASTTTMAMPSILPSVSIKLDRTNYLFWKSQILSTVRAHDLESFLLNTKLKPDENIVDSTNADQSPQINPAYVLWRRTDQFVLSWLLSSISEQMLGHVLHCKSASEVWIVLKQTFSAKSKTRALQLRLFLQTMKKGNSSVEDYILKMKSLAMSLVAAGQQITDDELILYILGGLGSEFEAVIVNLTSRESITLQEVQYILQTHEMRLEILSAATTVDLSSSSVQFTQRQFFRGGRGGRGRSFAGGRGRFPSGGRGYNSFNKPLCQIYGRMGHIALKCFYRFDVRYQNQFQNQKALGEYSADESSTSVSQSQAYIASPTTVNDASWFLNSGATHHVTSSTDSMNTNSEYSGTGKLALGDGSKLPITHIGHIILPTSLSLHLKNV